jgi:predicted metal-dependent hydrolase
MTNNNYQLSYGTATIKYSYIPQDRESLRLDVMPDQSIFVFAPHDLEMDKVETFLKRKYIWIKKQLDFFSRHSSRQSQKEYVSGESFLYLGRQYMLRVLPAKENKVKLGHRVIEIYTKDTNKSQVKKLFDNWLQKRIKTVFYKRLQEVNKTFGYLQLPALSTRKMNKRWGSYKASGEVVLNPDLIQASTHCIDYVIAHELTHIKHKNHDANFYSHLESKIPNWKQRKNTLESQVFGR